MRNVHHRFFRAFLVTLWGFPSLEGNTSKLGLDLDDIICLAAKKNVKLLKLAFSLLLVVLNRKFCSSEVFKNFLEPH
jgi:hypothetical protein